MLTISHRGNLTGPHTALYGENHPSSIDYVLLNSNYNVEIDLWRIDNKLYLGHDKPDYQIDDEFLNDLRLWVHCKNIDALYYMADFNFVNSFFHNQDDCTLTSQGFIWTYPKNILITNRSIAVMPELVANWDISSAFGICTDYCKKQ